MNAHFELRRGPFRYDAQGQINQSYQETSVFTSRVSLSGVTLPAYWDGNGFRRFAKHLRILCRPASQAEWVVCFETDDLPLPVSDDPEKCSLLQQVKLAQPAEGIAFRLECEAMVAARQRFAGREQNFRPEQVPFALFYGGDHRQRRTIRWDVSNHGEGVPLNQTLWHAPLTRGTILPGNECITLAGGACFMENAWCRVGFSLRRPALTFLSWDCECTGRQSENLLEEGSLKQTMAANPAWQGPLWFDDNGRIGPFQMGEGAVSVEGARITYHRFQIGANVTATVSFELQAEQLVMDAEWEIAQDATAYEAEVWRFLFNLKKAVTCVLAPLINPHSDGAQGRCAFPAVLHAPNFGSIRLSLLEGDALLGMDSHRADAQLWAGIVAGAEVQAGGDLFLKAGRHKIRLKIEPVAAPPEKSPDHPAYRRMWAGFFGFRPELMGMSNNSASVNCLFTIHQFADGARAHGRGGIPDVHGMTRYSLELLLRGGSGYGYPEYFMDSNPSCVIAAGVLSADDQDTCWLEQYWSRIRDRAEAIMGLRNDEGLVVCTKYTANSGERIWSCNWWDVVTFGHIDAYSNALAFRALSLAAGMAHRLGYGEDASRYARSAAKLKEAYWSTLFNPATGWIAGWKSADGQLHDHAFVMINSMAICYGLVPPAERAPLMDRIQTRFKELGYTSWMYGVPGVLAPLPAQDTPKHGSGGLNREDGRDLFEVYQSAGATMSMAYYYIRALGLLNRPERAEIEQAILDSFEARIPVGGLHTGTDWRMWDGTCCGYEGLLTDQYYVLVAILQNKGCSPSALFQKPAGDDPMEGNPHGRNH